MEEDNPFISSMFYISLWYIGTIILSSKQFHRWSLSNWIVNFAKAIVIIIIYWLSIFNYFCYWILFWKKKAQICLYKCRLCLWSFWKWRHIKSICYKFNLRYINYTFPLRFKIFKSIIINWVNFILNYLDSEKIVFFLIYHINRLTNHFIFNSLLYYPLFLN